MRCASTGRRTDTVWCSNSSFVQFQVWDFPGQLDYLDATFDSEKIFGDCGAVIFVLDSQDEYTEAMQKLHATLRHIHKVRKGCVLYVVRDSEVLSFS